MKKSQRCFLDVVSRVETSSEFLILVCIDILDALLSGILIKQLLLLYTTYKHITLQEMCKALTFTGDETVLNGERERVEGDEFNTVLPIAI